MPPITTLDLITDALIEIGVYAAGETPSNEDAVFCQSKANRLFDAWNADGLNIYSVAFLQYILKTNTQPLTIGQAAQITQASLTANVATYIAKNTFKEGQAIDIAGNTTAALNGSGLNVASATPSQFTVAIVNADIPLEIEGNAKAVFSGNDVPNYATATQRPVKIIDGNIILNNVFPNVKSPLNIRDDDWWANERVPGVVTTFPTDLYYSADWPNGKLYFWPIPTIAYGFEIECWTNLADLTDLTSSFYLPQGYREAVTLSLAETLCPAFGRSLDPTLEKQATKARARIQKLNATPPRIGTRDPGMPRAGRQRASFNYRTKMSQ